MTEPPWQVEHMSIALAHMTNPEAIQQRIKTMQKRTSLDDVPKPILMR